MFACCLSLNSITPCRQPMLVIACHSAVAGTEVPRKACQKAGLEAFALQSNIFGRCLASRIFEVLPWCRPGQRFFLPLSYRILTKRYCTQQSQQTFGTHTMFLKKAMDDEISDSHMLCPRLGSLYSNGLAALVIEPLGWRCRR